MSSERRRYRRYDVEGLAGTLAGRERQPFEVLTLSHGGLLVTMGFEPPLGQVVDVEIPLDGMERGAVFHGPGRVVFIGEDNAAGRGHRYRVGIGLDGVSAEDGALLDRYIQEALENRAAQQSRRSRRRDTEID